MIAAIDGNVFAGKTTLLMSLSETLNADIVPEYSYFLELDESMSTPELRSPLKTHLRYLEADKARMSLLKNEINLLDRSFVSLAAHAHALFKAVGLDLREKHIKSIDRLVGRNDIIIPDKYIFLDVNYETCKERYLNNKQKGNPKKTDELFIRREYFYCIRKFNLAWQGLIKDRGLVISREDNDRATSFIKTPMRGVSAAIDIVATIEKCYEKVG